MKRILLLAFLLGFICIENQAQDSNTELLNKLVEKGILTQDEANEINGPTPSQSSNVLDKNPIQKGTDKIREAFNTPYLRFGGYGLFMYQYKQYDKVHHDANARVVFLSMRGNLTKNLSYFILTEFVDPRVYEFYAEWSPYKFLKIKGGQMKIPFSFENPISLTDIETILNTRSISSLVGMVGDPIQYSSSSKKYNRTGRDIGLQLSGSFFNVGDHDLLHYAGGVFQGTGMGVSENNSTKDFSGILTLQPLKEFRFAGSLYAGQAEYQKSGDIERKNHVRNRWSLSAEYKTDRLYARSEWIRANDGGINKEALYGTALWYFIPKRLNVVGKVDYFNQNKDLGSEVIDYTAGVNFYFWEQCRLQVNYTYSGYTRNWGGEHRGENSVLAQMQIVF